MDAVKYLKEKDRLCNTHMKSNSCKNCIINRYCTMSAIAENGFETAVAIVEEWSKAHSITNAEKFREVFGIPPAPGYGGWWDEPYEAPKEGNE